MSRLLKVFNVFLLLVLAACGSQKSNGLRVNIGAEPYSLDPRKARDLQSQTIAKMFFEGLTRINQKDQAELALAESVIVSQDGKTYTFNLRSAQWSNGDPVTAHDFVYAWKKVLDPEFPTDQSFQLYVIKNAKNAKTAKCRLEEVGIRAVDSKTLQVELDFPVTYFQELVAMPVFFPVHEKNDLQHHNWALGEDSFVCNGPFLLKSWKHSDSLAVVKNQNYWDSINVKLEQIELVMVSEDTELKMYEKQELDWAGSPFTILPINALPQLKKQEALHARPFLGTYFFRINVEKVPFNHPLIRKAFALAVNRKEIIENVTQGEQAVATGLVPAAMGLRSEPYFNDGDVAEAQVMFNQALNDLGLTMDTLPSLTLMYVAGDRNHTIAQAVQQQWRNAFGLTINLEAIERKVYFDKISKRDFELATSSWTADFKDPINFLEVFKYKSGGSNNTAWEHPKYAALLDLALSTPDPQQRLKFLKESEAVLMDEMPIIPVFYYTMLYMMNEQIKDVVLTSLGNIDFKWAYIAKGEK
jgi:oligopeptide transport system substrate-binding protein